MRTASTLLLHTAAVGVALLRGLGELASLQAWRLRDRLARRA